MWDTKVTKVTKVTSSMANKGLNGPSMAQQFETSSRTRQLLSRSQGESSRSVITDVAEREFFNSSRGRRVGRPPAMSPAKETEPRLASNLDRELAGFRPGTELDTNHWGQQYFQEDVYQPTTAHNWVGEFQTQRPLLSVRDLITGSNIRNGVTTTTRTNMKDWLKILGEKSSWNESGWLENQLVEYKLEYPENNFVLDTEGQLKMSITEILEDRDRAVKVSLLNEAESQQLRQLVMDRYGFDINWLIWDPEMKLIPKASLSNLIHDLGAGDPYLYHDLIVTRDHIGSVLLYEELVRQVFHRELFAVPMVQLLHHEHGERYTDLDFEVFEAAKERLTILNDLQYDTQADVLNLSDQQLLDYIAHAEYIPLAAIKTLSRWFLGRQSYRMKNMDADVNAKHLSKIKSAIEKEQKSQRSSAITTKYRLTLPGSEGELLDELKRLHMSYGSYIRYFSGLEVLQLKHHLRNKLIKASYLPETRDELVDAIDKGSFKWYLTGDKERIIKNLNIPYPVSPVENNPDARLISDRMFFDWLESTEHLNVKSLSREFLTAYRSKDFEAIKRIVTLTSRLMVPLSFNPFKGSGSSTIDELLLERVRDDKLRFINSSSRL